jgi:ABC-2 type transport system ATP-binding protein
MVEPASCEKEKQVSVPAIRMVDLHKEYRTGFWMRRFQVLTGITLDVHQGESFGFVGPNGAGKTTTIKILAGLHEANSGTAEILGIPANNPNARFKLGFLPERPYFYIHLSAKEVLRFYGKLFDIPDRVLLKRIDELLERTNMMRFTNVPLGKYSKGMLQRIGLCQTLLHDPDLIILDEPMSGLDPVGRALVKDIILEEKEKGKTIFFSSHVLSDVESICDRIAIIVSGELRGVGSIADILGDTELYVDCHVRIAKEILIGTKIKQDNEIQVIRVRKEEVNQLIDFTRGNGGSIQEVLPVRRTLEEVLVDEIKRNDLVDHKKIGVFS